jgi:hypothetical protein
MDSLDRAGAMLAGLPQSASPEQYLMGAVLQQAVDDLRLGQSLRRDRQRHCAASWLTALEAWFADHDPHWPFSFENICVSRGVDADAIREALTAPPC